MDSKSGMSLQQTHELGKDPPIPEGEGAWPLVTEPRGRSSGSEPPILCHIVLSTLGHNYGPEPQIPQRGLSPQALIEFTAQ